MHGKGTLDERLPGMFEPDTLLPIQYFEAMHQKHLLEGEKRLILSVLEDAVDCYMKCIEATTHKGQRLFREAEEWINLEDKHWVFSFDNVCEMLDINPEYMRRGLRQWKEARLEQIERRRALEAACAVAEALRVVPEEAEPAEAAKATGTATAHPETFAQTARVRRKPALARPARRRRTAAGLRKVRA